MNWLERRWYENKPAPLWLKPLSHLFYWLAERKRKSSLETAWRAPVPIIVVGNISVGGTGKTPVVTYLVEELRAAGYKPGVISRGYGSKAPGYPFDVARAESAQQSGDEPLMIQQRCNCPVVIDADRCQAARYLLEHYDCDLIISDDGLQHYKLQRDIEIAVIDGSRGLGNQSCLPAGPLREPPARLQQVDYIVVNGPLLKQVPVDDEHLYEMTLEPQTLKSTNDCTAKALGYFANQKVNAIAGIGNPERFFESLEKGLSMQVERHPFPDHYHYSADDLAFAKELPLLMTEKDAVKVRNIPLNNAWYLEVSAHLPDNFLSKLLARLRKLS